MAEGATVAAVAEVGSTVVAAGADFMVEAEASEEEAATSVRRVGSAAEEDIPVTVRREAALMAAGTTQPACPEAASMAGDSGAAPLRMDSVPEGLQALIDLPARRGAR
jgi:hypothetical protein